MDTFKCNYCFSTFVTKGNLSTHLKYAKKCLEKRGLATPLFNCMYCKKNYTSKQQLTKHINKCPENSNEIILYKQMLKEKENQIKQLEKDKKKQFSQFKELLNEKEEQIKQLQEKLGDIAEIGAKKDTSKNTYKVQNNVVNQLVPYDLDKHTIGTIVDKEFTENHLYGKENAIANFAITNLLKDGHGNYKMTCTDTARKIFVYKDKDGNLYKDVNANGFLEMYIPAVAKKSYDMISSKEAEEMLELSGYITSIEPTTVSSKLAERLTPKPT
jgi:predicted phage tail protein